MNFTPNNFTPNTAAMFLNTQPADERTISTISATTNGYQWMVNDYEYRLLSKLAKITSYSTLLSPR